MSLSTVTLPVSVARLPSQTDAAVMVRVLPSALVVSVRLGSTVTVPQVASLPPPLPIGSALSLPRVASTRTIFAPMVIVPQLLESSALPMPEPVVPPVAVTLPPVIVMAPQLLV